MMTLFNMNTIACALLLGTLLHPVQAAVRGSNGLWTQDEETVRNMNDYDYER
jgi:outer membrane biogenesis lipoprotein LolB